jgi:hypothetical protein
MRNFKKTIGVATLCLVAFSCEQNEDQSQLKPLDDSPLFMELPSSPGGRKSTDNKYAVLSAEYLAADGTGEIGRTIYFTNVGNKQLTADFVPGLSLDETDDISYYIDETRPSDELAVAASSAAISRAMNTWDNVTCSELGMTQVPSDNSIATGYIAGLLGYGGSFDYVADLVHAGWAPASFFNMIAPQGSTYILGVTFTIIFTDDDGNPTDVDNNGKADVAWREIYYNDAFPWAVGAHYDVETIALHEAGHGLSQAHFGKAFLDGGQEKLHFSPRAVMNAAYSGIQTQIGMTDNAGHCSNWSSWNQN